MRFFAQMTGNADAFYEPNSFGGASQDERFAEPPLAISSDADRYNHPDGNDDSRQVTALFNLFDGGQRQRLYSNVAEAMWGVKQEIVERQLAHFQKVHPDYAAGCATRARRWPAPRRLKRRSSRSRRTQQRPALFRVPAFYSRILLCASAARL